MNNAAEQISPLTLAILGLLASEPRSGYDLRKIFDTTPMGTFSSSPGAIYPALKRLRKTGWIKSRVDKTQKLRPREMFSLTALGKNTLLKYLVQPVTLEAITQNKGDLMLRFTFIGKLIDDQAALKFLQQFAEGLEQTIKDMQGFSKQFEKAQEKYVCFSLAQGVESFRADLRWARAVLRKLEEGE